MTMALKTFLETEIVRQEREIKSMQRKVAKGENWHQPMIAVNQRNVAGYRAELADIEGTL